MSRAVRFERHGAPTVLDIVEVPEPHAGRGQVRVRVLVAGLNPLDYKLFGGRPTSGGETVPVPSGNGNDFAGVVDELGEGVAGLSIGDQVFGGAHLRAQADFIVVSPGILSRVPAGLSLEQAGGLDITARTAAASVRSLRLGTDDTVLVSAAAGGVGVLASQLARRAGATVIGTAGEDNHEFLASLGVIPVSYGAGLVDRVREVAPEGITAALDNHGRETVDAALDLGAPPARVNTIADYGARQKYGTTNVGAAAADPGDVLAVAELIASGELVFPIDSVYPFEEIRAAYDRLLAGHLRGKIVLRLI